VRRYRHLIAVAMVCTPPVRIVYPRLPAGAASAKPSAQPARRAAGHFIQRTAALIFVKKAFAVSGYENLDSANSVEFLIMIGVSVCNRPARAE
jgi:hypothetical protein